MKKPPFALSINELTVHYHKTPVLWDITCDIPQGKKVAICGPNGAGKTTLLKSALGLIEALSGSVRFLGEPLNAVYQKVAYVPQRQTVDWDFPMTVQDLVLMGRYGHLKMFRGPRQSDIEAVERILTKVQLAPFKERQIKQLSGGQQQRAFLARALMQEADIFLMDEPFIGIDTATKGVLYQLLDNLKAKGKTVIVVHHDLHEVSEMFDYAILLNMRLIAAGDIQEVMNEKNLSEAYGKSSYLLDQAFRLSQKKSEGLV